MLRAIVFMACVVSGLISFSACTTALLKEANPEYFSQIIKKPGECADISGKYEFSTPRLAEALETIFGPYLNERTIERCINNEIKECTFSTIEIHSDDNSLEFVVNFDDKEVHKSISEESGDYLCYGDGIILSEKNIFDQHLLGPSKELTIVYPAVDGALFLWHGRWSGGLILLAPFPPIPFFSQEGLWHRLEPVGKEQIVKYYFGLFSHKHPLTASDMAFNWKEYFKEVEELKQSEQLKEYIIPNESESGYTGFQLNHQKSLESELVELAKSNNLLAAVMLAEEYNDLTFLKIFAAKGIPHAEDWLFKVYAEKHPLDRYYTTIKAINRSLPDAIQGDPEAAYKMWLVLINSPSLKADAKDWLCFAMKKGNERARMRIKKMHGLIGTTFCQSSIK